MNEGNGLMNRFFAFARAACVRVIEQSDGNIVRCGAHHISMDARMAAVQKREARNFVANFFIAYLELQSKFFGGLPPRLCASLVKERFYEVFHQQSETHENNYPQGDEYVGHGS